MHLLTVFFWLLVGHAVADYPLQGDFLAKGKNHTAPLPGVPWWICLGAHALIHGGAVALATGSVLLGAAETVVHAGVDYNKCAGLMGFKADQAAHVFWKLVWIALIAWAGAIP